MKCNTGKIKKQRDVYGTIYKSMSYNDLVINAIAVIEGNLPYLPEGTRLLIVKSKMDVIVGEVDIFFFLDVNSIHSFKRLSAGENVLAPISVLFGVEVSRCFIALHCFCERATHKSV